MADIGLRQGQSITQRQECALLLLSLQRIGEQWGDIPIYSLHRIKNRLRKTPTGLVSNLEQLLVASLVAANKKYRVESKNAWNCLTPNNITWAIEIWLKSSKQAASNLGSKLTESQIEAMVEELESEVLVIRQWFTDHADNIMYDMKKKIPWAVVQRLQSDLSRWTIGKTSPLSANIHDMIQEIAREHGIYEDCAEDAWECLGGEMFER